MAFIVKSINKIIPVEIKIKLEALHNHIYSIALFFWIKNNISLI